VSTGNLDLDVARGKSLITDVDPIGNRYGALEAYRVEQDSQQVLDLPL